MFTQEPPPLVLVVEDEPDLAATVEYNLRREGLGTRSAATAAEALGAAAAEPRPDLILLDLMLPDGSGIDVCQRLRASEVTADIPILMVTALAAESERIAGFEAGADDYVIKPYSVRELLLRVKAMLRRTRGDGGPAARPARAWAFGCLEVDEEAHRVQVGGEPISLTVLEFRLLVLLAERKGRVQSRDRLLRDVWGHSPNLATRTVDTHVKRLRQKIGDAGAYIETVRGIGYRFRGEPEGHR